jgi:uncharacterized repeat protein (TIGR03803 family)
MTMLHSFDGTDGSGPRAGLVQATNGNFYGTTTQGGLDGAGTMFKITSSGEFTTLYEFCTQMEGGHCTDGYSPYAGLIQGIDGNLYGTTTSMGAIDGDGGTLFEITPGGTLTVLYTFCSQYINGNCLDGYGPQATLVQTVDGSFYGTTAYGGANDTCYDGCGTIFKITPSGALTTLHSFEGTDGDMPLAALVQATNGNVYGTTAFGGSSTACGDGCGVVFKITSNGTFTTLLSFDATDGAYPDGALVQATDGNLYEAVQEGGTSFFGTIVKIELSGKVTTLYIFDDGPDGGYPQGGGVQGTNGIFYGTTAGGGTGDCTNGCGTVFSLNVGLGQFVETLPASGKVGATVKILGSFLTGATSVAFNGTPATFTVDSKSEITTRVPTGATTGTVQVISPRLGTLSSDVPFGVKP